MAVSRFLIFTIAIHCSGNVFAHQNPPSFFLHPNEVGGYVRGLWPPGGSPCFEIGAARTGVI